MENDEAKLKAWESERQELMDARMKNRKLFACALNWMRLLESGEDLLPYFQERDYRKIGIYGAGELAEILIQEMRRKNKIQIVCLIDQSAAVYREEFGLPVYLPEEFAAIEDVDMVVVTAITYFDAISEKLVRMRPEMPVVSLEEIIRKRISEECYE